MFESLFGSKNQKLAIKWMKEHEAIVVLANKIIAAYTKNDDVQVKKHLEALRDIAINHIMTEDIEFFRLLKDESRLNSDIEKSVNTFKESFRDTKIVLRNFLRHYTQENVVYDEEFFTTFNTIVEALGARIEFEEKNLYKLLSE